MKQLIVLSQDLMFKDIVETDFTPKVFDCIVPQKITINLKLGINVNENDIIILRDDTTLQEEFIGIIETINKSKLLQLQVEPFISLFNNDCLLSELDGKINVQEWIVNQINANFINTEDVLNKYNIIVRNFTEKDITYKSVNDTDNLMEILNEIYLNTGIYVDINANYENGVINAINCDIYNANEQEVKKIRFDNPQIINEVDYKYSQYGNYSKASILDKNTGKTFYFYLRQDNKLTTNPKDNLRMKKVKNKNVNLTAKFEDNNKLAEGLVSLAQKELLGDAFAYSIQFNVLRSAISDWKYRQRCDFRAEDRLFQSYITNIEYLSDKEARVTLGAYRYTLTDKLKYLTQSKKQIGDTFGSINISNALGTTTYYFTQENGDLILNVPDNEIQPNYYINDNGELIYEFNENNVEKPDLKIDKEGELVYNY